MTLNYFDQNLSADLRAHIYQKLSDLEGHLPKDSSITVKFMPADSTKKTKHTESDLTRAIIQIATPNGEMFGTGVSCDLFEAVTTAHEHMVVQLNEVLSRVTEGETEENYRITYLN